MTNEEFIKPIYKVIADYPNSPYDIGDLVETSGRVPYPSFLCTETSYEEDGKSLRCGNWVQLTEIEKYPHLFRRLESQEEMTQNQLWEKVIDVMDENIEWLTDTKQGIGFGVIEVLKKHFHLAALNIAQQQVLDETPQS